MAHSDETTLHIAHAWFLASSAEPIEADEERDLWNSNREEFMGKTRKFLSLLDRKGMSVSETE
ncbi:hypothetical protein [Pseudaestuariivita atlantica]|uniref:Uncharacterized protein n=1 Tax=Pseudaestuariivita atlantica TaxID=1317121 RepID=A0A0L1JV89_9RHOB|nr:hypothetical protein [Pseudaestuariivita atlantica]KNG95313.1 hypothetical protein ATO11_01405 [Pseudaestuariivita atlantica]